MRVELSLSVQLSAGVRKLLPLAEVVVSLYQGKTTDYPIKIRKLLNKQNKQLSKQSNDKTRKQNTELECGTGIRNGVVHRSYCMKSKFIHPTIFFVFSFAAAKNLAME